MLAITVLLVVTGCNQQKLFMPSDKSATIPGGAIAAYAQTKGVSPEEARQAMITDNLTSRGASLPKEALQPSAR
jgi:hypothetical protein